jgi:TolB-like protein/Tfp pilus assembly protein PilF
MDTMPSSPSHDVFVSYASQDVALADGIVAILERNGLKCWIAPRDVQPGAQYADGIIRAINGAKVMVLVLSKHAVQSSHVGKEIERASAKKRPLIALRTDATPLTPAFEYFLSESQWIDVGIGGTDAISSRLVEAVRRLVAQPSDRLPDAVGSPAHEVLVPASKRVNRPVVALIAVIVAVLAYVAIDQLWLARHNSADTTAALARPSDPTVAFAPPAHSIAVLPFVNMSGDPKQDYFSDGLSEELLNSLAAIPALQVAARTSSFTFKGKDVDVAEIARKLNVGAVLEGSVRKGGNQVRITAQLINAVTGFHLWSNTYDRDLKNVLTLQTEIATAVTKALQATLMADAVSTIEIGGTQNPAAFDAYLRGTNLGRGTFSKENVLAEIALFSQAISLDPKFAKAYVAIANAQSSYSANFAGAAEVRSRVQQSRDNAEKAVALMPESGEAHAALAGILYRGYLDITAAETEYGRALALSPNDADVLRRSGVYFVTLGRTEVGLANVRRAISLDQLNPSGYERLATALFYAHQFRESVEASDRALQFNADDDSVRNFRGLSLFMLGELDAARPWCATAKRTWVGRLCVALLYDKLHQRSEAEAELAAMKAETGDGSAYQYAEIYAQWGDIPKALDWLETAYRLPDPGISTLRVDSLLDPLRKEPRFQEIERKLKLPN